MTHGSPQNLFSGMIMHYKCFHILSY